jgi:hypothetical protein
LFFGNPIFALSISLPRCFKKSLSSHPSRPIEVLPLLILLSIENKGYNFSPLGGGARKCERRSLCGWEGGKKKVNQEYGDGKIRLINNPKNVLIY